jgi:hypothetical protein
VGKAKHVNVCDSWDEIKRTGIIPNRCGANCAPNRIGF